MQNNLAVGLVGFGYAGQTFHAPLIAATAGLDLRFVASSQPQLVTDRYPDTGVLFNAMMLINQPDIDLVVLATPNASHYPLACEALDAGKHVVVDKPFTLTLAQAKELALRAQVSGKVLSIFHNRRWDADFLGVKALLASGRLGEIAQFESQFDRYRPQTRDRWRERAEPGGGLWFDLGPHLVDQALQLFGPPLAVFADLQKRRAGAQAVDDFHVLLRYPTMRVKLSGSCLVSGGVPRYVLHGSLASFEKYGLDVQEAQMKAGLLPGSAGFGLDPLPGYLHHSVNDQTRSEEIAMPLGHYMSYYAGVRDAVLGLGKNPVTAQEGVLIMQLLEAAQQSAETGAWVIMEALCE
ncbi:oxidoreductase [Iodobacter ciconiae]|uniref:Oxidoreductase n=1 Tax=Iodobacter ciconiae TaxID=2496266 RepID=A0A3S8ZR00_9NEIS|nr:oxidoreductase [Iodobacter ciconiae]AZN35825.1 oxidoreductase [Iodobacter ciconiae]